ncbi:HAD-IC family P-type ATPase [Pseudoflavitalea sp. G-6-1-2]|uniref:heavy metal translocating P-type ATPase n=1 Tax=Pseudoflavitalea sp. G-6-1-2 TaxID=2728841 RepID=UPI00146F04C4|nr:heavy metal translocating P-type ATPase metal-binding domain-containing protein [Pseudoflavitalea sp. G-6-1-2]NML22956.1 HAD-IC family P-type ATPase [Pseudoflavitalea sp. G-6-1-2]
MGATITTSKIICFHCGEACKSEKITFQQKTFCCEGCKMVYRLLNDNGLCEYYDLNQQPGINQRIEIRKDKFAFLEEAGIRQRLISFEDDRQTHVTFYLPSIHCSSCLYLLENLHKLNPGVISARVHFTRKEVSIVFDHRMITLRECAELLNSIGYEPYISLHDLQHQPPRIKKRMIYQLGVAGFSFANIMLLSFPEYLGLENAEISLQSAFRTINVLLALPVFFFSAQPFFSAAWNGLKNRFLNIDAPIALAILVTFSRSLYEVFSGTGAGYFDSMSGIVFFMLLGRVLQDRTYQQLSFDRDYTSYFPIAVTVLKDGKKIPTALPDIKPGDTLLIHNQELIPADGILTKGNAAVDYSFVTGESIPVQKEMGELLYAGGKQTGNAIELLVIKEVAQGYLTKLWLRDEFKKEPQEKNISFVHLLSKWFTVIVFSITAIAAIYWGFTDSSKVWNVITAVLIVACPCALLLSNSFTNGNVLRILGRNRFYLRGAQAIEDIANANHIVFDKTGTLTTTKEQDVVFEGSLLPLDLQQAVTALAAQSTHPLSKVIAQYFNAENNLPVHQYREVPGYGIEGFVLGHQITLGSSAHVGVTSANNAGTSVYLAIDGQLTGFFRVRNRYRPCIPDLVNQLGKHKKLSVLSGDNSAERQYLQHLMGDEALLLFDQKPEDKLHCIQQLQQKKQVVMMIGDGLNDAGALKQSNIGIAITEDSNNFTPASDAILEASQLHKLPLFIQLCKANRNIVLASFIMSILYNIVGICFAVQGILSPLIAAILMPASSLSIVLLTFGCSNFIASRWKL